MEQTSSVADETRNERDWEITDEELESSRASRLPNWCTCGNSICHTQCLVSVEIV